MRHAVMERCGHRDGWGVVLRPLLARSSFVLLEDARDVNDLLVTVVEMEEIEMTGV